MIFSVNSSELCRFVPTTMTNGEPKSGKLFNRSWIDFLREEGILDT